MPAPFPETRVALSHLLRERGLHLGRDLGQRFLMDGRVLDRIVALAAPERGDFVLEVGTGIGTLTRRLAPPAEVLGVEIDRGLHALASELIGAAPGLDLRHGDIMSGKRHLDPAVVAALAAARAAGRRIKVVSNLPYAITTPFLAALLLDTGVPDLAVLMVQREAALQMTAAPGSREWGVLPVLLSLAVSARIAFRVPPEAFWPVPAVSSAVVVLAPRAGGTPAPEDLSQAVRTARALFPYRRKTVLRAFGTAAAAGVMPDAAGAAETLRRAGVEPGLRVDALPAAAFLAIARELPASAS